MQRNLFYNTEAVNLLPFDGEAIYYPEFLPASESREYFSKLLDETNWKQWPITLYEKEMLQPRLTSFYGETNKGFEREGFEVQPYPWTETLLSIKQKADTLAGVRFTHALLNLYRNGQDSVSWHRDSDKIWGIDPVIGSVSLGTARLFQMRNYKDKTIARSVELSSGSLLIMRGSMQRNWEHQVPKTSKRIGPRINITFRILK